MTERPRRRNERPSPRLRWRVLHRLEERAEPVMTVLGIVWLLLFIVDMVRGSTAVLLTIGLVIWVLFIAEFGVRLLLAPDRGRYILSSWLTVLSLVIPALRVFRFAAAFRVLRAARAARGIRLVRAVASVNRGLSALGGTMRRRGVGYVVAITAAVTLGGAAGMFALERHGSSGGFASYGDSLWWTSMILTTMGSAYWPETAEGRMLAFLLSLFAMGVFGYLTATLASFFVGRDAADGPDVAGARDLRALRQEMAALRRELRPPTGPAGSEPTGGESR